jgi:hypothetical protein
LVEQAIRESARRLGLGGGKHVNGEHARVG